MSADEPGAGGEQKATADRGASVVQARDIHGGVHLGSDQRALGLLSPYTEAESLAAMPHDEAARLLAREPVAVSAPVVAALLTAHKALAVGLLGSIARARAEELLGAVGSPLAAGLEHLPEAATAIAACAAGDQRLGARAGRLGRAARSRQRTPGYFQRYRDGVVHWSERGGAHATTGAAWRYYAGAGGTGGLLGFPLSACTPAAPSAAGTEGTWQRFEGPAEYGAPVCDHLGLVCGATVYCCDPHGAHGTWGAIGEYYESVSGTLSWLGFPVGELLPARGPERRPAGSRTTGSRQAFEGGVVFHCAKSGAVAMRSELAEYCHENGGDDCPLGFPVSEELDAIASPHGTTGTCQRFEWVRDYPADITEQWAGCPGGAAVYRAERFGICTVAGAVGRTHERLGGTGGWLGFPVGEKTTASSATIADGHVQPFEGGTIFWNTFRAVAVRTEIVAFFGGAAALLRRVGFPVARESALVEEPDLRVQRFEGGLLTLHNGVNKLWLG